MKAYNVTRNQLLVERLSTADTFWKSLLGLLPRKELAPGEGLWIVPCQSVHTIGMRFPIDVLFLDREGVVLHLRERMKSFRVSRHVSRARGVLEIPAGMVQATGTRIGDVVTLSVE
jgi:uncharacterized membrane protein (UPF0127 family)